MLILKIECLKSLSFWDMEERENGVEGAATDTCTWLLNHAEYRTWLDRRHALLWIVGNPGAGKSTLMRYALQKACKKSDPSDVVASFFFFGRGSDLQRSSFGLFRSLFHQLLREIPEMLSDFIPIYEKKCKIKQKSGSDIQWYETELRDFLEQWILSASRDRSISIYVDALDEAGQEVAEKLIEYFEELIERLGPSKSGFAVCFSCRHYPHLVPKDVPRICVDAENDQDIATYVRQVFTKHQFSDPTEVQELEQEIIGKASSIFQWVVLIIRIIIEADVDGVSVREIRQMIKKIPNELGSLYDYILSQIKNQKRAAQMMQWVCFALRPLSLNELRYAMVVDITNDFNSLEECQGSVNFAKTDEQMKRRVKSLSGGLAETVEYEDRQTVRFIHQSVNDYLIERGLQKLDPSFFVDVKHYLSKSGLPTLDASLFDNIVGLAHFRISRSCVKYVIFKGIWEEVKRIGDLTHTSLMTKEREIDSRFPLLRYSGNWVSHAQCVEKQRIPQADLLSLSRWPSGHALPSREMTFLYVESDVRDARTANLLHIASQNGLLSVIEKAVNSGKSFDLDSKDLDGLTPLSRAVKGGHEAVVRLLIQQDSIDINSKDLNELTPLSWAAKEGHEAIVRILIQQDDIDIDLTDYGGQAPVSWAAANGHEAIVQLLIEKNVKLAQTLLSWAAREGDEARFHSVVQRDDIDIDSKNRWGETPLSQAARNGHEAITKVLVEQHAKIDSKDYEGRTPLLLAAIEGHEAIIKLLIEQDVEIDSKDIWGETPLSLAAASGHKAIVQILIDRGAEIDSRDVLGRTPLSLAKKGRHKAVVQLLIERDAKVDTEAMTWAIGDGLEALVRLSIDFGLISVHSERRWEQSPSSLTAKEKQGAYSKIYMERHHSVYLERHHFDTRVVFFEPGARQCRYRLER